MRSLEGSRPLSPIPNQRPLMIPFNKPYLTGRETEYIRQAVENGHISGNGAFTQRCQRFFEAHYGIKKCLLTSSCTDALEMAAMLCDIRPGDEVIVPSYTFVSSALAFVRQGAKIVFADSYAHHPNLDPAGLLPLITSRTKAIVVVHYAGVACDMDAVMDLACRHKLWVVEDAAQAVDAYYKGRPLGSIGHLGTYSFHETKNIISGEGGALLVNDARFIRRAEILWEKGTNRAEFFRGEVNKYGWVDTGSSFLPSEIVAAFLWAQIECLQDIQEKRKALWSEYLRGLTPLSQAGFFALPSLPDYATPNAHMFYLVCRSLEERTRLIAHLKAHGVGAVFHYLSLHKSPYYQAQYTGAPLPHADAFSDRLLRLPMYYQLTAEQVRGIVEEIAGFYVG